MIPVDITSSFIFDEEYIINDVITNIARICKNTFHSNGDCVLEEICNYIRFNNKFI